LIKLGLTTKRTKTSSEAFFYKLREIKKKSITPKTKLEINTLLINNPFKKTTTPTYNRFVPSFETGNEECDDMVPSTEDCANIVTSTNIKTNNLSALNQKMEFYQKELHPELLSQRSFDTNYQTTASSNESCESTMNYNNFFQEKFNTTGYVNINYGNFGNNYMSHFNNNNKFQNLNYINNGNFFQEEKIFQRSTSLTNSSGYIPQNQGGNMESPFHFNPENNRIQMMNNNFNNCNNTSSFPNDKKKLKKEKKDEVDQSFFVINLENVLYGTDKRTTIMIRHIPNKYSTTSLLEEINIEFKGKFDFFYLPMDYDNQCNLGYAFVNFVDPLHVLQFYSQYKSRKWKKYKSHKECDLSYAKFQGKNRTYLSFREKLFDEQND